MVWQACNPTPVLKAAQMAEMPSGNEPMAQEVVLIYACSSGQPESGAVSLQDTGSKGPVVSSSWRPGSDCGHTAGMRPLWRPKVRGARPANWCLFCMAAQMAEMPKGNEPMARAVVLIYARSAVLLDLSSTSDEAPGQLGPVAEHGPKLRDVTWSLTGSCRRKQLWAAQNRCCLSAAQMALRPADPGGQDLIVATRQV